MHLLTRVERLLRRTRMAPARFGREAAQDPRLVFDLRRGRQMGPELEARLHAFVERQERRQRRKEARKCARG